MITCGLKLTHDGAIAIIDGDRLVFSVEIEKIANGKRYSNMEDLDLVPRVLADFGFQTSDVDRWAVDGWDGRVPTRMSVLNHGVENHLMLAPYKESDAHPDLAEPGVTGTFRLGAQSHSYASWAHAAGHLASAYCSSPFASRGEPAFVLVWDGGLFPQLYWVDPDEGVTNCGSLFPVIGHVYAIAGYHFGPFVKGEKQKAASPTHDLAIAGKLMAYVALGQPEEFTLSVLREEFDRFFEGDSAQAIQYRASVGGFGKAVEPSNDIVHEFFAMVASRVKPHGVSDEDVLATVHRFLEDMLASRLEDQMLRIMGSGPWNVCFVGGCALNIKWNSALRRLPSCNDVWVPPFPNDSGSAIGSALLARPRGSTFRPMDWDVHLGPELLPEGPLPDGWDVRDCSVEELARVLHESGGPVVVLQGRAELGPRALGGRSILAAPTAAEMKAHLNKIKNREGYRPVAPICLASEAPAIFHPGTPDPFMLFDHQVRPEWVDRIPAVVHLDGTARLQTVDAADNAFLAELLTAYHRLSDIPVLCNTSANLNGSGFFPDVASAISWGQVPKIWSRNRLFEQQCPKS
ncbi:carbamoyltransferase N-terminal domain-containing protein [Streptomyces collinus]|uniref:carbamoyltransferase N-terminal domain-containing protein n=1 Tax=Streptomyces collinus TaxID=42684 RepID=UPI0036C281F2